MRDTPLASDERALGRRSTRRRRQSMPFLHLSRPSASRGAVTASRPPERRRPARPRTPPPNSHTSRHDPFHGNMAQSILIRVWMSNGFAAWAIARQDLANAVSTGPLNEAFINSGPRGTG